MSFASETEESKLPGYETNNFYYMASNNNQGKV
jgi:hypothetical protein